MNDRLEESTSPRVRWSGLYVRGGLMLGVLLLAQAFVPPGAERTASECGLVLVGFGAMVQWTRRHRAALDRLDWCACASSRTTVRVVASSRTEATSTRDSEMRPWDDPEPVELEEISR